jgi:hypothetical protein
METGGLKENPGPSLIIDGDGNAEVRVGIIDELNESVTPLNVDVVSCTVDELSTDEEGASKVLDRLSERMSDELA